MKIRETINNNKERYTGVAYEDKHKIIVIKRDTFNYYDASTNEQFEFNTIAEYENWKATQAWINNKKVQKVSSFKAVY